MKKAGNLNEGHSYDITTVIFADTKTSNYCLWLVVNFDIMNAKGQLNSEWIYEVIVSPKMPTKFVQSSALPNKQGL